MVIDDKGLMQAMKHTYRAAGYKVARDDCYVHIYTSFWHVRMVRRAVPRKILGLLVEHMGELPARNTAYEVKKKTVQDYMIDAAKGDLDRFITDVGDDRSVRPTDLSYAGMHIWQEGKELRVLLCDPESENLAKPSALADAVVNEDRVCIRDAESAVCFFVSKYCYCEELLEHLGKIRLVAETMP